MARDRIAKWSAHKLRRPTLKVGQALRRYLGEAAMSVERQTPESHRWVVCLHGSDSRTFPTPGQKGLGRDYRGFAVYVDEECIDVITGQADEYTNAVADGFFEACVRYWGMEKEGVE
jgi:hypothetical protein